jgi:hypothetical protein
MASIREYFDGDFSYTTRVHVKLPACRSDVEVAPPYDFSAFTAFLACYVLGNQNAPKEFLQLIEAMQPGKSQVTLDGKVTLPSARMFPGQLEVKNTDHSHCVRSFMATPNGYPQMKFQPQRKSSCIRNHS